MGCLTGVLFRAEVGFFIVTAPRLAMESTQPSFQWVMGALTSGTKWPGSEAYQPLPPNDDGRTALS
jgi:hypothetical protein